LDVPAVIVMPVDAPALKIENTRSYGAEVIFYDRPNGEDREVLGETLAEERGLSLVRPYDNPYVIAGQGTCGIEITEQAAERGVDAGSVLVCCGGGGLSSGIALACETRAPQMSVIPVEPEVADDVCRSLLSGQREQIVEIPETVCDAIITPSPGELTFPILKRLCSFGLTVSDDEVAAAVRLAARHLKILPEPGGSVALAAAMVHGADLPGDALVVVVTGANGDMQWLSKILSQ